MRLRGSISSIDLGLARFTAVSSTGIVAAVVAICCAACGAVPSGTTETSTPPSPSATADQKDCARYDSFSGRLTVGQPVSSESPGLTPVQPGDVPAPVPLPTLADVTIETSEQTGSHVHFRITGDGIVGWTARFVQAPTLQDTSETVSVLGSCVLQVDLSAVDFDVDSGDKDRPTRHTPVGDPQALAEVLTYPSRNGLTQTFIGLRGTQPQVTVSDLAPAETTVAVTVV